jgi:putative N6-adenine methyltransferase
VLLEHDDRFGVFPEFVFYDFQQPLKLPGKSGYMPGHFGREASMM